MEYAQQKGKKTNPNKKGSVHSHIKSFHGLHQIGTSGWVDLASDVKI